MLSAEDRLKIHAEEVERLRVRRRLERYWRRRQAIPWIQFLTLFLIGAVLGFAALTWRNPDPPPHASRLIVVDAAQ